MPPSHIGKYEVQRRLGAGGMGSLYLARDPGLDRLVAIKLLKDEYQDDPELRERFIREARSVARLRHENIIIVFDIGEADGLPFMAMEYIAGETVAQLLRRSPTPPLTKRLILVEELCAGLAHAHGAGIIHRDIKPANLMITSDGVLKVLDFGIARLADSGMTQGGMMLGTVNYMSPEQVAGPTVDHRSDIFATGAVMYELIALEQAFPGRIDSGVLNRILNDGPTPIEQRVPGIDPALAAIVRRALERDPNDRYQSASEMGRDVARVRRRLADAPPAPDAGVAQNTTVAQRPPSVPDPRKSDSSRPKVLSPERFAELQRQQVEEHLRFGEAAFAKGDHDSALHYGERAAMVNPESRAAIELINRARFAIASTAIRALLAEARRQLADGRIDDAATLVDQAGADLPYLEGAEDLRAELMGVSHDVVEARNREQRITSGLDRARASIEQGGYETALRALYEVLAIDPDRTEARELEQSAMAQLQAQREHQRARRQAHDRLTSARQMAAEGRYDDALAAIGGVDGPSDTVRIAAAAAADEVRAEQRRAQAAAVVAEARSAFDRAEFQQTLDTLDTIAPADLSPDARSLRADAQRALRERVELERKQKTVEDGLRAVAALIDRNELTAAGAKLDEIDQVGLSDPRIPERRAHVAALVAAAQERRRQEARDRLAAKLVEAARQLLENGDGHAAIALLERDSSGHGLVIDALRDVRATVAEREERARQEAERQRQEEEARRRAEADAARKREDARLAEEQRRREEERRAREAELARRRDEYVTLVAAAEQALSEADLEQATVLLRRADNIGRVDDSGLAARAAAAKAEAERQDRERAVIQRLDRARDTPDHEAAIQLLQEAQGLLPGDARVEALLGERQAALEDARAREAAVTRILSRERQEDADAALTMLREALTLVPGDQRVESRIAQRHADIERQQAEEERRRRDEERRRVEEARRKEAAVVERLARARDTAGHEAALAVLEEAQDILPGDPRVAALIVERRAALDGERAEAARVAEAARRREEEAREREAAVTRILSRERQEQPDAALTMLREALTIVPGDQRVEARIAQRHADIERQRAEEERQRQIAAAVATIGAALDGNDLDRAGELLADGERQFTTPPFQEMRRTYDARRRQEERARREAEDAERRRQAREEKEARARQAREEKEQAAQRRREQREAQRAAAGTASPERPAWLPYAAAAIVVLLVGGGGWALWPRPERGAPSAVPSPGIDTPPAGTRTTVPPDAGTPPPTPTPGDPPPPRQTADGRTGTPPTRGTGQAAGRTGRGTATDGGAPASGGETPAQRAARERAEQDARDQAAREQQARDQAVKDQAVKDQAARDQAVREQAARDQAAREQAAREQAARDQAAREQAAREQAAATAMARERAAIQQLLNDYVQAYSALDERRLRQLVAGFTGIPGRALIKSVELRLSNQRIDVSPDGQTAAVTATQNFSYEWNRAGADRTATGQLNWRLRKTNGVWTVQP